MKGDIMKIAISSVGTDLDAQIDPRFGRCAHFIIVETDNMNFEAFDNENIALGGGAGIQSAQFVASKGTKVIITGNVGPNAVSTLSTAGIQLVTGQAGTVREAIEDYKMGKLTGSNEATASSKSGMMARGAGMGRGRSK
jgi:predicted Fe-Mo cluster-binding NifX family protein